MTSVPDIKLIRTDTFLLGVKIPNTPNHSSWREDFHSNLHLSPSGGMPCLTLQGTFSVSFA